MVPCKILPGFLMRELAMLTVPPGFAMAFFRDAENALVQIQARVHRLLPRVTDPGIRAELLLLHREARDRRPYD